MAAPVVELTVIEFAAVLGVTAQRVYQLIQAGLPHRRDRRGAKIVPRDAIRWIRERDRDEAAAEKRKSSQYDKDEEYARKLRAEASMKEIDLEQRRGEVVPIAEFTMFVENFAGGFSSIAAGQLSRFERQIVAATTAGEAQSLRREMQKALMRGAQEFAERLESEAMLLEEAAPLAVAAPVSEPVSSDPS